MNITSTEDTPTYTNAINRSKETQRITGKPKGSKIVISASPSAFVATKRNRKPDDNWADILTKRSGNTGLTLQKARISLRSIHSWI